MIVTTLASEQARGDAAACLRAGQVVAYPTDTLYALGAMATHDDAVRAVLRIKERLPEKTLPLIAADLAQVAWLAGPLPAAAERLARQWWPGPLTLVVEVRRQLAPGVVAPDGSVAVRIPAHDLVRDLVARVGTPITSTSANRAGAPPAQTAEACLQFGDLVAAVLDDGPAQSRVPSTIVDVRTAEIRLIRPGAVPWERVLHSDR